MVVPQYFTVLSEPLQAQVSESSAISLVHALLNNIPPEQLLQKLPMTCLMIVKWRQRVCSLPSPPLFLM